MPTKKETRFTRLLDLKESITRKSTFLFGPRSSGKTYLYETQLTADRIYDLLNAQTFRRLNSNPSLLLEETQKKGELIVIDEVQKIPHLLDEVHRTIEKKGARFLLTGSSARKLKRSQSNMLGGRATQAQLFPLVSAEIEDFNLSQFLRHGGIPRHYLCEKKHLPNELEDYVSLYLREEIAQEAVTRNLDAFSRFLDIMAIHSGDELAIENFASDCAIKASTFRNYIEVLKDTLIGFEIAPYLASQKRKAITRSKFFLFDVGVTNHLAGRTDLHPKSESFGRAFEHFIAQELRAYLSYHKRHLPLCYWRSVSRFEVDFIIGRDLALEVKSTDQVHVRQLKGLRALREEKQIKNFAVVSLDPAVRNLEGIDIYPYAEFLRRLWSHKLF